MTALGKTLVFVLFVFSLLTGYFVLVNFEKRTIWKAAFDDQKTKYGVSEANVKAYSTRAIQAEEAAADERKKAADAVEKLKADVAEANRKQAQAKAELDDYKKTKDADDKLRKTSAEETKRRGLEVENMQKAIAQRETRIAELDAQSRDFREKFIQTDVALKSTKQREQELLAQNIELNKEVERLKSGTATASARGSETKKPPEDVEGQITEVDAKAGLVTISIGSDSGLSKGNTLEVYRLQPEPKYLGTIMLLDVRHHQAVGKPVSNQKVQIQKGDKVAASVMAGSGR